MLFKEQRQEPLLREAGLASSGTALLPPGKALGVLLAASDRELRQACESASAAAPEALGHALQSFVAHMEGATAARELVAGCLNHLLEAAPPKRAGQRPRAVRLLLAAACSPGAWLAACATLGDTLRVENKRLKLAACIVLREVLLAHLSDLGFDPRSRHREADGAAALVAPPVQARALRMHAVVEPVLPLLDALLSVAERDAAVDSASARCDLLPTRLTTLAADCCIVTFLVLGRLVLLPPALADKAARSGATTGASGGGSGIVVLSGVDTDGSGDEHDATDAATRQSTHGGAESPWTAGQQLWTALPAMEQLLRLLRQWYGGRKATLVIGIDGLLARLAPLSKLFALEHQLRESQKDGSIGRDGGELLGLLWGMLGPPLLADGDGLVQELEAELKAGEDFLPTNSIALSEDERKYGELPCEMAVIAMCLVLGRAKKKTAAAALADASPRLLPRLLQVLHTGWAVATRVSSSLAGLLLTNLSTDGTLQQVIPSLFSMMDSTDAAADAVVALIAQALTQASMQLEEHLLSEVLVFVDSSQTRRRGNGVKVLEEVVRLQREVWRHETRVDEGTCGDGEGGASGGTGDNGGRLMQRLCSVLLRRLTDDELAMRCRSSELLAQGEPGMVLPQLCRMLYARDARARAAAERALVAVLSAHKDPIAAVETLLNAMRTPLSHLPHAHEVGDMRSPFTAPRHPGDVGANHQGPWHSSSASSDVDEAVSASDQWPSRVMRLLPKWAESLSKRPSALRAGVARLLVSRVFAAPHDTIPIQACSAIAAFLAAERSTVLPLVIRRMSRVIESEKVVLRGMDAAEGADMDQATRQEVLFARLSPLLILKLLPKEAFALEDVDLEVESGAPSGEEGEHKSGKGLDLEAPGDAEDSGSEETSSHEWGGKTAGQCIRRLRNNVETRLFADLAEFKPVREVAAEIYARLPPQLTAPRLLRSLVSVSKDGENEEDGVTEQDDDAARTAVLVLCHAFGSHGLVNCYRGTVRALQRLLVEGPRRQSPISSHRGVEAHRNGTGRGATRPGHLQDGCAAALSAAVAGHLAHALPKDLLDADKVSACPVLGSRGVLEFVCRALSRQPTSLLPEALGSTCVSMDGSGKGEDDAPELEAARAQGEMLALRTCHLLATAARAIPPNSQALRAFSKAVVPTCLDLASGRNLEGCGGCRDEVPPAGVRQGTLHVLFIVVHGLGDQAGPLLPDVLNITDDALTVRVAHAPWVCLPSRCLPSVLKSSSHPAVSKHWLAMCRDHLEFVDLCASLST